MKGKSHKRTYKKSTGSSHNAWISHVKAYANQHMLPYKEALKEASKTYH